MRGLLSKVETSEYEVLETGSLILSQKGGNVKFFINDIIIELCFENDANSEKNKLFADTINDKYLKMTCKNFGEGAGPTEPIQVCLIDNMEVYIKFIAFQIENLPRIMYTFYKKVAE